MGIVDVDGPAYLRTLRDRWRVLVAGLVLGGLLGAAVALTSTPIYQTDVRFFIATAAGDGAASAYEGNLFSQQRVTSYAELITDQQLVSAVIDDLKLDMTTDQLAAELQATVVANTVILDVSVSDPSPTRAVDIANSVQRQFTRIVGALETPGGATTSAVTVHVIAAPQTPGAASSPRPLRDIAAGALLGLAAAAAGLLVRARLDTRIRDSERAARHLDAPSIGVLLQDPELARLKVLPGSSTAPAAETLRQVGTNLDFIDVDNPPRVLTITSSVPGEGKTTLATNLAIQLAGDGKRVVLVDADLRRPRAARFLGAAEGAGLTQVLNGSAPLADVLQQIGDSDRLHFLAAGPAVPNPGALLGSARMAELLETLRQTHDVVLLDAAPLLAVADTSRLVPLTDGAVVCARWGAVHDRELGQTRRTLARVGARTLGVVLTFLPRSAAAEVGYGSVYGEDAVAGNSWRDRVARRLGRSRPAAPPTESSSGASPAAPAADQPLGEPATTPPEQEAGAQVVALPADQRRDDLTRPIVLPAAAVRTPEDEPATRL